MVVSTAFCFFMEAFGLVKSWTFMGCILPLVYMKSQFAEKKKTKILYKFFEHDLFIHLVTGQKLLQIRN